MTDPARLFAAIDATWPPAEIAERDGWCLRRGEGGGRRVSAASPLADGAGGIAAAEAAMRAWGQAPLFRVTPEEALTDAALAEAGYAVEAPVVVYAAAVADLADDADETARIIRVSTRVALLDEIWQAGGIGPARRAVMARAAGPRVALMVRLGDRPAGCGFVAADGEVAMLHAVEVLERFRRQGAGVQLARGAANWAREQGAATLALAVERDNIPARALYAGLGMAEVARYHYRRPPEGGRP